MDRNSHWAKHELDRIRSGTNCLTKITRFRGLNIISKQSTIKIKAKQITIKLNSKLITYIISNPTQETSSARRLINIQSQNPG